MRRTITAPTDRTCDEREIQFDIRALAPGDRVDVFFENERRWERGTLRITAAGDAVIDVRGREPIAFDDAVAMGIRRLLH